MYTSTQRIEITTRPSDYFFTAIPEAYCRVGVDARHGGWALYARQAGRGGFIPRWSVIEVLESNGLTKKENVVQQVTNLLVSDIIAQVSDVLEGVEGRG
jgi:hypothetical protein